MTAAAPAPAHLDPALQASGLSKAFGHVTALYYADLAVAAGEVVALVGDNGAGKSTMLKILSGLHSPDTGIVHVHGVQATLDSPLSARALGIATVHQDLALVEVLDIATNLHLGDVPRKRFLVDRRRMERESERVLRDLKVRVGSVRTPVGMLSGGQRQIIAISRAVRLESSTVVLLDEPTAALGVQETRRVGDIIRGLRDKGKAVLLISHDIDFVFAIADHISVLRLGRTVAARRTAQTSRDEIIGLITGSLRGTAA